MWSHPVAAGPFSFQEISHAVKVKIMAPFEVRVRRVMEQDRVDHKTATARVHTYHRDLCGRIDFLFGRDWTQPENYDFVLNTRDDAWQFYTDLLVAAARHRGTSHAGLTPEAPRPHPGGPGARRDRLRSR